MAILSRIRGSAFILKLAACAAWFGLPVPASAHQQTDAQSVRPAVDDRTVPLEYDLKATQEAANPLQRTAQRGWLPPPPPPPPPAVASVRG
jgi:hypothetical protein